MKKLLLTTALASATMAASAQYMDGEIFPDFTAQDINGTTHTLYDYLDQGYTVVLDVSAAWCSPCWSYHTSGALEDLFYDHGPLGMTNVSASTTDDVMVLFIEGETTNTAAQLTGTTTAQTYAGFTQGDWVTGTLYPIIDANTALMNKMNISYFPTVYTIYPDRTVEESGTLTAAGHYSNISNNIASHSASTGGVDADVLSYLGDTKTCSTLSMDVRVQNKGDQTLAAGATVEILDGSTVLGTGTTSTSLDQFDVETVSITVSISSIVNATIKVTATGDINTSNGTQPVTISLADESSTSVVTVQIATDRYGTETSWTLKNGSNQTVASGNGYTDASASGTYPQADTDVTLNTNECYTLTVNDSFGDGMDSGYGTGYVRVVDGNGNVLMEVSDFESTAKDYFLSGSSSDPGVFSGVDENILANMNVYPNPFSNIATISFENGYAVETEIKVTNMVGQIVINEYLGEVVGTQTFQLNGSELEAGIYMVTVKAGNNTTTRRVVLNK
ncbi:MAG: T9SS type A sorting domain-containing protein [Flavobacteriales bacterium]|nr:T9SS type A sorting domain-containing protein [Flavobacteriales bacterium]